jgi:hypothetical protein
MSISVWVAAGVALLGAIITWLFLPAKPLNIEGSAAAADAIDPDPTNPVSAT